MENKNEVLYWFMIVCCFISFLFLIDFRKTVQKKIREITENDIKFKQTVSKYTIEAGKQRSYLREEIRKLGGCKN